ncbi:hypothetical protein POL68_08985 [Stigmatella sp. ncwal1]|uniref:GLTT repeat-containing protein n=1 Tax=Stigmatella ashevillensis TaxID=2995309 RepID=A0ABT5D4L1_9BACT|nr:hypothetical protein [Stigmatella ashevillena]MDC0708600.1 hypothetical protein [Stigmatella ashevillena]
MLLSTLWLMGAVACGTEELAAEPEPLATQQPALEFDNGLSANGLSANGLSANGLSANGLSANGLSSENFRLWFTPSPAHADMVMQYLVRCALPAGESRTYTHPSPHQTFTWQGGLGLAPVWASGQPIPLAEQQLITACLAAHVNKYGVSVLISVLGKTAAGQNIPYTDGELLDHSVREACFFGNLFTNEGIFVGNDSRLLSDKESSSRACVLSSEKNPNSLSECPPMVYAEACEHICTRQPNSPFYATCTWKGITYQPITTRIRPSDIYKCGDGVCQFTESCGRGDTAHSCQKDCGRCP